MEERQFSRQVAGWSGFCHIEGESASGWPCLVVDLSSRGLGLTFQHQGSRRLVGRVISVDLPADGHRVNIWLQGEVKHCTTNPDGTTRAGVQFVGLSEDELSIVHALGAMMPTP